MPKGGISDAKKHWRYGINFGKQMPRSQEISNSEQADDPTMKYKSYRDAQQYSEDQNSVETRPPNLIKSVDFSKYTSREKPKLQTRDTHSSLLDRKL